jgi:hypothetical protein
MAGGSPVLTGVLFVAVLIGAPVLLYWTGVRWLPALIDNVAERRKIKRAQQRPAGQAIEAAVADLRRLRREVRAGCQPNHVRHVALLAAYDSTLIRVCRYIEVDAPLADAVGSDRPFARLITESAIEEAGIVLDPPGAALPPREPDE